eukprot:scaffold14913_cov124-Isochrysis_galbana.AAC.3
MSSSKPDGYFGRPSKNPTQHGLRAAAPHPLLNPTSSTPVRPERSGPPRSPSLSPHPSSSTGPFHQTCEINRDGPKIVSDHHKKRVGPYMGLGRQMRERVGRKGATRRVPGGCDGQ